MAFSWGNQTPRYRQCFALLHLQNLRNLKAVCDSSHPRNPVIAEACFKGGYIDSWGSGIMKIIGSCREAGLPTPDMNEKEGGFIVTLFKDKFVEEFLQRISLNDRQIKAVLYVKEKGRITNSEYQDINNVSKRTATNDLSELVEEHKLFKQLGASVSTYYEIV